MTEPLVNDWVQEGREITVAALPHIAPVYRAMQGVAQVLEWSFKRKKIELLKRYQVASELKGHFDVCVICPNSFKAALIPWLAGVPTRIGYLGEFRRWFLTQELANPARDHRGSMVAFYRALGPKNLSKQNVVLAQQSLEEENTSKLALRDTPNLSINAELTQKVLLQHALTRGSFTVIAPGAEYGNAKRWPTEYFAALVSKISSGGTPVLILGSEADRALATQIKDSAEALLKTNTDNSSHRGLIKNLAGQTTLTEAMALIASAKSLISNDSGLMHIGAAFATPQVAIFGSSSPLHTPPLSTKAKVLWLSLECSPCFKRTCPLGHLKCLREISVESVVAAELSALNM